MLVDVTSFKKRFITLADGIELARQSLQLVVILDVGALRSANVSVKLGRSTTLRLFLADKLSLCLSQVRVPLVCILAIFLQLTVFALISDLLGTSDFKFCASIFILDCLLVQSVI